MNKGMSNILLRKTDILKSSIFWERTERKFEEMD